MSKRIIFSVVLFIFSFSSWGFEGKKLDELLELLAANDKLMVSVAVTEHGQPVYQKAVGFAGAIVATPGDVARFMSGLFAGKLISPASLMKMIENVDGFGHGLARYPFHKKTLYGYDGSVDGFRAFTAIQEQDDVAVAITANGVNYSLNDITVAAFSSYYGLDFELPDLSKKAVNLSGDALQKFEGTFASKAVPLKITITLKDGQLSAQATGQPPLPLTPFSETEFRFEPAGIAIVFDSGEAGINEHRFVLRQGGGEYPFIRE